MLLEKWIDFAKYIEMFKEELAVLDLSFERALERLENMGIGMLVIFVIIGIIILATVAINKIFSKKD